MAVGHGKEEGSGEGGKEERNGYLK